MWQALILTNRSVLRSILTKRLHQTSGVTLKKSFFVLIYLLSFVCILTIESEHTCKRFLQNLHLILLFHLFFRRLWKLLLRGGRLLDKSCGLPVASYCHKGLNLSWYRGLISYAAYSVFKKDFACVLHFHNIMSVYLKYDFLFIELIVRAIVSF